MSTIDPLKIVGTTLAEKYAVYSLVHEGHFGSVYSARNLVWDIRVAIRAVTVIGELLPDERQKLYHRMLQEGAILTDLSDRAPAICRTRDVGTLTTPDGVWIPYVVTEWLEGTTLDDELHDAAERGEAPRTLAQAVTLLDPIANGLALAHDAGLVHHNVNPANVLLVREDEGGAPAAKLLDLGVGRILEQARQLHAASLQEMSLVIPAYAAPEQLRGDHAAVGASSDVFALAVLVLETAGARRRDVRPEIAPTPRTLGLEVSDGVEKVFAKALAHDPSARFATAGELWASLRAALGLPQTERPRFVSVRPVPLEPSDLRAPSSAPAVTASQRAQPRRSHAWVGASMAGALVASLAGVAIAHRAAPAPRPHPAAVAAKPAAPPPAPPPKPTCPAGMIEIPGGTYFMGSDEGLENERPAHNVTISPFCIDRYEVTTAKFKACSDDGKCKRAGVTNEWSGISPRDHKIYDPLCNASTPDATGQHPINCVNWEMASLYCQAQGGRLPTEAEWEFAARGPDGRAYPWGDEPPSASLLNACGKECAAWGKTNKVPVETMFADDDGFPNTAPVGSFPKGASRYGVEDVVGNVWEWVSDWQAPYGPNAQIDPQGPTDGEKRVVRGGAWNGAYASWVRPTFRFAMDPTSRSYGVGFRCARPL